MPEQGDIVRIRGDERFAQVLGEAMYLKTEVRFLRFEAPNCPRSL